MEAPIVELRYSKDSELACDPTYASDGASGMDLHSAEEHVVYPGRWRIISTGLRFEIPGGYELQIRPRSGLAAKFGVTILNTPGAIDSDYRGVCKVILFNRGVVPFNIKPGTRIAQAILQPISRAKLQLIKKDELSQTGRGEGGFGSTGLGRTESEQM